MLGAIFSIRPRLISTSPWLMRPSLSNWALVMSMASIRVNFAEHCASARQFECPCRPITWVKNLVN